MVWWAELEGFGCDIGMVHRDSERGWRSRISLDGERIVRWDFV